ncbi:hypothetical protein F4604DRAFT_1584980 [Suillus subluteus]|nr:hypothetical protein F4604DRAFT_1584980 [Suillus subluteus]
MGVLYELNSVESAAWFNISANHSKFLDEFSIEVVIRERAYHIIVENVPINFIPEQLAALADIEKKAGLKPKSITKARYIKPISRCSPEQQTAHVILTLNTKEGANQVVKFRLLVAGKKV